MVKPTTRCAGGLDAAAPHDDMAVRNACCQKPGPASTGAPVAGFADPDARVVAAILAAAPGAA